MGEVETGTEADTTGLENTESGEKNRNRLFANKTNKIWSKCEEAVNLVMKKKKMNVRRNGGKEFCQLTLH